MQRSREKDSIREHLIGVVCCGSSRDRQAAEKQRPLGDWGRGESSRAYAKYLTALARGALLPLVSHTTTYYCSLLVQGSSY